MASDNAVLRDQFLAGADLSAESKRYTFAKLNSSGSLIASVLGDAGFPIVQPAVAGEAVTVDLVGESKVRLGGTVAPMDPITSNASGLGIVASTTGHVVNCRALMAGVSGDVITVLLGSVGKA